MLQVGVKRLGSLTRPSPIYPYQQYNAHQRAHENQNAFGALHCTFKRPSKQEKTVVDETNSKFVLAVYHVIPPHPATTYPRFKKTPEPS